MHSLYLDRLVLVQFASKFKLCRFYIYVYKNTDEVCVFCLWILYFRLLYSIVSATFVLFLTVEPTLEETTFSF